MENSKLLNKLANTRYLMQEAYDNDYDKRYDSLCDIEWDLCQQLGIDDGWSPLAPEYAFGQKTTSDRKTPEDYLEELQPSIEVRNLITENQENLASRLYKDNE